MDDIDRQLIGLLRNDARASVASLAKALGVARGTVQNRMARLAANGTIVGYTVRLQARHRGAAHARLHDGRGRGQPGGRGDQGAARRAGGRRRCTAPTAAGTSSRSCAPTASRSFDRVLARIRLIEGISQTETSLLLSTFKF